LYVALIPSGTENGSNLMIIAPEGSTMRLSTNAIVPDSYIFNIAQDKFRYLRSSTLYPNTNVGMNALLTASTIATPNAGSAPLYYADFTVPASTNGEYLYLIWDLRDAILTELCYYDLEDLPCCKCETANFYLNSSFNTATSIFIDIDLTTFAPDGFYSADGIVRELSGGLLLPASDCGGCPVEVGLCFGVSAVDVCCECDITCITPVNTYTAYNPTAIPVLVGFYNDKGTYIEVFIDAEKTSYICSIGTPICENELIIIEFFGCGCEAL